MLKKTLSLIVTFQETVQAMAAEAYLQERSLPGRLIPVPREITAGCGLAWKAPPDQKELLCDSLNQAGIRWQQAYILEV